MDRKQQLKQLTPRIDQLIPEIRSFATRASSTRKPRLTDSRIIREIETKAPPVVGAETIKLQEKEIFNANQSQTLELTIKSGVLRAGGNFDFDNSDVTLALFSAGSPVAIKVPTGCTLHFEALIESCFTLKEDTGDRSAEGLSQWLINLHLVRQLIGAEARLIALFQLLVEEFGFRHKETYSLPFWLSHARLAEMISTSRGTVTRQITYLRKSKDLAIDSEQGSLIISSRLMELRPNELELQGSWK